MGQVISISSEASVLEAVQKLLQYKASKLPVTDSTGNLVGVVTKENILHRVNTVTGLTSLRWLRFAFGPEKSAKDYIHLHGLRVREVMSKKVFSTPDDASLTDIVRFMERHRIKWLPVVHHRKLVGIISQDDLISAKLLLRRMAALHLNDKALAKNRPVEMHKLQRVCSACVSQNRCKKDLANSPQNELWQQYCPNAGALVALQRHSAPAMLDALAKALDSVGRLSSGRPRAWSGNMRRMLLCFNDAQVRCQGWWSQAHRFLKMITIAPSRRDPTRSK